MAQVAASLKAPDLLEAFAHGFRDELQSHFPKHIINVCKIKNGWIVEGEFETIKPARGLNWKTVQVWYNVIFQPAGVRIDGVYGRLGGGFNYEDPRFVDAVIKALFNYVKPW